MTPNAENDTQSRKLLLLDGMALVYRSYYALNRAPRMNSKGINTSATLGFVNTLYDLIKSQKPTHVAVCFDLQKPTFRHIKYTEYKANREAMPEDIQTALPYIHQFIEAFHIPILTCEGYEADDVIGTASHMAEVNGFDEVLMVTPDKDFAQLVTEHVHLYRFGRMGKPDEIYGVDEIKSRFSVNHPRQVADILGLWGDSIDNIPGIPGVGEKKAKQLVQEFGSVEDLVLHADEVKNAKLRDLVKEYKEQALLSKELATIALDAPITFDEQALKLERPDYDTLRALCDELEFKTLIKKIFTDLTISDPETAIKFNSSKVSSKSPAKSTKSTKADDQPTLFDDQPTLFDSITPKAVPEELEIQTITSEILKDLNGLDVAIYIEGPKIGLATSADMTYSATIGDLDFPLLKAIMENPQTIKVCHNLKNMKYMLQELDIQIAGTLFDVQLAHYLIDAEARHSFDFICSALLGYEPATPESYAAALWQLFPMLSSKLREGNMESLYYDVELPLVDVLISMEQEGVRIDVEALKQYSANLTSERNLLEQEIYDLAEKPFNISSPKQLGEVLFEKLKVTDKPPRTATKQYSTAEDVLLKLRDKHPIIEKILEYRSINKLIGTYLDSFPKLINPTTQRLHTIYNQAVTATGRLSSSNPNLQNIPIRTERGREIRRAFVPRDEDYILLAADYSQIELRIIASLSKDEHMISAFSNHYDIHAATAAKIYKLPMEEVSKDLRRNAKSVNFGIVYGISAFGLSEQLGINRKEAAALIEEYFAQYPAIKSYIDDNIEFAHEHGYAQTLLGRRRYLNDINSRNASARAFAERNAVNMPIQGTSADMIKIAMINIYRKFNEQNLKSKMILQVHDELVFDVYKPELDIVKGIVEKEMLDAIKLDIPIEVGIDIGQNWLEAH